MNALIFKSLHIFGVTLWIGGVVTVALFASKYYARVKDPSAEVSDSLRDAMRTTGVSGMVLAWLGGLAVLIPAFTEVYAKAGWMHGKLLVGFLAAGLTGALSARVRKIADASPGDRAKMASGMFKIAIAVLVLAVVNVCLAVLKPGG